MRIFLSCCLRRCLPFVILLVAPLAWAGVLLEPKPAPEWMISEWINGNPGSVSQNRGKVILINFFQLWCPGSNEFSIPLFQSWQEKFGVRDDVLIVSIHTVFEGHAEQTPDKLKKFVAERGITHPVGIDSYPIKTQLVPATMDRYQTGGTPHVAIIDKEGELRFSHFGRFDPEPVERFITRILEEEKKLNVKGTYDNKPKTPPARPGRRASRQARPEPPPPPPEPEPERVDDEVQAQEEVQPEPPVPEPDQPEAVAEAATAEPEAVPEADDAGTSPDAARPEGGAEAKEGGDQAEDEPKEKAARDPNAPDPALTGSYKLRFEQTSKSCGEISAAADVITQVTVYRDRIVARFSRPYLGVREIAASYNESGGDFQANLRQDAADKGGAKLNVGLQMTGRFLSVVDPVELEYHYSVDQRSEDGSADCIIEGRGIGTRFRGR